MTEKSTMPCGALFERKVWCCRMYSVAPPLLSAAVMVVTKASTTSGTAARAAQGRQRAEQRNPVHEYGCGERGEHRQRSHLHPLQHQREQHDDEGELCGLAHVERAQGTLPAARSAAQAEARHCQAPERRDPATEQRRDGRKLTGKS